MLPARLRDLSAHGAYVDLDPGAGAMVGQQGVLVLTQAGNGRASFDIRSINPAGQLHVRFLDSKSDTTFTAAVTRLLQTGRPSRAAA